MTAVPSVAHIWLITGVPGAGKTTVAGLLARRFERGAHIEGDVLRRMIVSGAVWPDRELAGEAERQYELGMRNQCLLARSFAEAGFTPVLDAVVVTRRHLEAFRSYLLGGRISLVALVPEVAVTERRNAQRVWKTAPDFGHLDAVMREELDGVGLWVDSSELTPDATVDAILAGRERALVR